ncbi:hypothetical protein D1P53_002978 [Cryptococcus gattii VGV]|nr:hypothetical protein D1P53_002978 [Cryptococcus gattii VGV]
MATVETVLASTKQRVTAILHHDDRLYIGLASGVLEVYSYSPPSLPQLLGTRPLARRQLDQLAVLPVQNYLAVLADSAVTLYTLPSLDKVPPLPLPRTVHALAATTYSRDSPRDLLVLGGRKKVVVYGASPGGFGEAWELPLPHSPRHIIFPSPSSALPESIHLQFTATTSAILHLHPSPPSARLSISDLTTDPLPPAIAATSPSPTGAEEQSGYGKGALSGLGGYVGLGGKQPTPVGTRTVGGEVLLAREDTGVFYSSEGNYTRQRSIHWPYPPDGIVFSNPYIYSILPSPHSSPTVQIHLASTLSLRQTVPLPLPSTGSWTGICFSLSSPSPDSSPAPTPKLLIATYPTDKSLHPQGSTIHLLSSPPLSSEIQHFLLNGHIDDAIGLVEAAPVTQLDLGHLKILKAVQLFASGVYQPAMELFVQHNVNPALVLSLFPKSISGGLGVGREGWMELFGAPRGAKLGLEQQQESRESRESHESPGEEEVHDKDGDSVKSIHSVINTPENQNIDDAALEALLYFLSDRRQKLSGAISSLPPDSPLPPESSLPPLHALPPAALRALPSIPFTEMNPEELVRMAQVVYTALMRVYLKARPVLVGSLCRIENWCDVKEVEGLLKEQSKFGDLIDLYQGKKMHRKALTMLHELAKEETDKLDRYPPTISYLHKLGVPDLDLILEFSKWILEEDPGMALTVFTADEPDILSLPRDKITAFLSTIDRGACEGYLEYVIWTCGEEGGGFHDKLAELYMVDSRVHREKEEESEKAKEEERERENAYTKLLKFLNDSTHYRPYRLLNKLSGQAEMPEARAILLGRMGKHEEALKIYVYRLHDYTAAESYCVKAYQSNNNVFLLLLQLYLRPPPSSPSKSKSGSTHLPPALSLISKHSSSLPASSVLDLLPPLVSISDRGTPAETGGTGGETVGEREERGGGGDVDGVGGEESEGDGSENCHKRLGMSAIAVHAPRGEVTHLHCKDKFSAKLAASRD